MKQVILFLTLLMLPVINSFAQEEVILESADHAEYLKTNGEEIFTLWGGVKINYDKTELEADWIQLNLTQDELLAKGKVILIDKQGYKIEGKEVKYNLTTKRGNINSPYIFATRYYCRGNEACFEPGTITFSHAQLTTCNLPEPHYHLSADEIIIYPNDKIKVQKIIFKIGKVPLFYFPSYSISLKPRKILTTLNMGKSDIKGTSLNINTDYLITPKSIASLHLNLHANQGIGQGIEHKYFKDSNSNGKSYLYYINERKKRNDVKDTKRWEIDMNYFQRVKNISGILHLHLLSDKNVTRDNLQEREGSAATLELKNYLAITKTYPNWIIRLVSEQKDFWNNEIGDFEKATSFLPKITVQSKFTQINNIYSDLNVEIVNQSGSATNNLRGDLGINLLGKANLSKGIVFSSKVGLTGAVKEKEKATGWLKTDLNLRNRIGKYLEIDLRHNLKKKFTTDEYHGIETNGITSALYLWLNRRMTGKINTGIDIRTHKYEDLKINKARLLPLVAKLDLALSNKFITYFKTTYSFKSSKIDEVETYFDFKKDNWQVGGSGLYSRTYAEGTMDIFDISNYIAYTILPETYIRLYSYYDVANHRIKEYGLTIGKDLHCWNSKFSIRHGKDTEFWISFNLK